MHNFAVVMKYAELFIACLRNINDHVFVTNDENSRKSLISLKYLWLGQGLVITSIVLCGT